jgi:hypothetical protein
MRHVSNLTQSETTCLIYTILVVSSRQVNLSIMVWECT